MQVVDAALLLLPELWLCVLRAPHTSWRTRLRAVGVCKCWHALLDADAASWRDVLPMAPRIGWLARVRRGHLAPIACMLRRDVLAAALTARALLDDLVHGIVYANAAEQAPPPPPPPPLLLQWLADGIAAPGVL